MTAWLDLELAPTDTRDTTHEPDAQQTARWVRWRHHLHRYPETGFNERQTSDNVARLLQAMGWDVHRGIGGTGIVANLTVGLAESADANSAAANLAVVDPTIAQRPVIALRADMDALAMQEAATDRPYASQHAGCMHACGHDGHMAMLLGAAQLLSRHRDFKGTVRLIFQPAEEHGKGAQAMLDDGLLQRFPIDEIYGLHNIPGMAAGKIATRVGGLMASEDNFEIRIHGHGGHAARPQMVIDPLVIGAEIVLALQSVVARSIDPQHPAVLSCTEFITDGLRNVIPSEVVIRGDTRSYSPDVQSLLEQRIRAICAGVCASYGARCEVSYTHEFAPTVNWPQCVPHALAAARAVVGDEQVDADVAPMMISEDFGRFLQHIPGAFVFVGNGAAADDPSNEPATGATPLHNARYDFNDQIVPIGARYFATLVRQRLGC